jgi:glycosyltransferase involved in cell wall biosynthesis
MRTPVIAVLVPCLNEEETVAAVVREFRRFIPQARIIVADNGSTDQTALIAKNDGAEVISEARPGKGYAVCRMFADIDADFYVLVDGDGTYDPESAPNMVQLALRQNLDMVNGKRVTSETSAGEEYRAGHRFGNDLLTKAFQKLFGLKITDALTGYRVMSKRFVKSFPGQSTGFEIETDLNVHAALTGAAYAEVDTPYRSRPITSPSKLNTYSDGWKITMRLFKLFRDFRPEAAFWLFAMPWFAFALIATIPVLIEYFETGLVPRFPTLIMAAAAFIIGINLVAAGWVISRIAQVRLEDLRIRYLAIPAFSVDKPS